MISLSFLAILLILYLVANKTKNKKSVVTFYITSFFVLFFLHLSFPATVSRAFLSGKFFSMFNVVRVSGIYIPERRKLAGSAKYQRRERHMKC